MGKYDFFDIVKKPNLYFKAQTNPQKYFKDFNEYKKFANMSVKPSSRNSYTDQQAINRWLLSGGGGQEEKKKESSSEKKSAPFDYDTFLGGGKGGNGGRGGGNGGAERREKLERRERKGAETKGIEDKGLEFYGQWGSMTPAEFDLFKEIKLRNIDGENAQELQNIINAGKIEVAAIQRDASIYGSLVSGFW
jgi:hypothetical protein